MPSCYSCGQEIHFDPLIKSKNDRFIPLQGNTGTRAHQCPKKPPYTGGGGYRWNGQRTSKRNFWEQWKQQHHYRQQQQQQQHKRSTVPERIEECFAVLGLPPFCNSIDHVKATATFEEKVRALLAINALPYFRWHDTHEVCITAPIIDELKKHGITRVSHTQLPSYCPNFHYSEGIYFPQKTRAVYTKLADFVAFINPSKRQL